MIDQPLGVLMEIDTCPFCAGEMWLVTRDNADKFWGKMPEDDACIIMCEENKCAYFLINKFNDYPDEDLWQALLIVNRK